MNTQHRHLGLFSATSIGIGAIVGGGILALAGTAFAVAGPAAILAFALNGVIALITAFSFAELSSSNPQSGGTYLFARRTLTVGAAFGVGWIVWFASIVAAALYALGFASFALQSIRGAWTDAPAILGDPRATTILALLTTIFCTGLLRRSPGSGGNFVNMLKLLVFAILILGGAVVWLKTSPPVTERATPFMPAGSISLITAMGFTFISLQGFDLIAAVAGEVKEPRRALPRAMLLSLFVALCVYIPLLLIVMVVGIPEGSDIQTVAAENPDGLIAIAARQFLGPTGFWLVMASGVLAMFSALLANLFAASRIARVMAQDRTLPVVLETLDRTRGTPRRALEVTGALVMLTLLAVGDVSRAGAASSLIFLVSFSLTHVICILARLRRPNHDGFRVPAWPYLPIIGAICCTALATYQGFVVPAAGLITGLWLITGFFCYLWVFGQRARTIDAASEHNDPDLLELRGRSPLVLVPIANPANAASLSTLALCLSPKAGRVMLLNIVPPTNVEASLHGIDNMTDVLRRSLAVALAAGIIRAEGMITISPDPWMEIARVARTHRCAMTLLGMSNLGDPVLRERVEQLTTELPGNVAIVRAPIGWNPLAVRRILVPLGGRGVHNALRARLLTSLAQITGGQVLEIRYLIVVPRNTPDRERQRMQSMWSSLVGDESESGGVVDVLPHRDVVRAVVEAATKSDLVVLGLGQVGKKRVLGNLVQQIIETTDRAVILIGQRE